MTEKLHILQRRVRVDTNTCLRNHLLSIVDDSERVETVYDLIGNVAIYSNKRNGEWYINTSNINNSSSCYFKSTDGHDHAWSFSTTRLNLDVAINAVLKNGCLIVDSTRRGKQFPDSFRATIPIWCSVINAIVLHKNEADYVPKLDKPPSMSKSHISLIDSMLVDMIKSIPKGIIDVIYDALKPILNYPLKPLWMCPSEEDGEIEWFGDQVDEVVDQLPNININKLGYIPIILFSCSRVIREVDYRPFSWTYIQGAGDDEENWCQGLTANIFWKYKDEILSDDPNDVEVASKFCLEQSKVILLDDNNNMRNQQELGSFSNIGQTGLSILQFKSYDLPIIDLLQLIYRNNSVNDETNIILIIEPNPISDKDLESILRFNSNVLVLYISLAKKECYESKLSMVQPDISCLY